jgi:hypothetical protein
MTRGVWNLTKYVVGIVTLFAITACSELVNEGEGTFVYKGQTLRSVEREFATENGTFKKRYIYSKPHTVSCSATDDADCVAAIVESRMKAEL